MTDILSNFFYCFDTNVSGSLIKYTTLHQSQNEGSNLVTEEEFYCFIGILIPTGNVLRQRKIYCKCKNYEQSSL